MNRLLVIGYVWPEPGSSAAGSRMLQLLQPFVDQGWLIHYTSPAAPSVHMADIASLGIKHTRIEANDRQFDEFVRGYNPDIVIFDRFFIEEQFGWRVAEQCPQAMRILETVDLHCLRHAREQALKRGGDVTDEDFHSDIARREIASIYRCDLSLIISEAEMVILQHTYHVDVALLYHVPFLISSDDVQLARQQSPAFDERTGFMFIGNYQHAPNRDAIHYLKQSIWPAIRARLPAAELSVYGAYFPDKLFQLHQPKQGFLVIGRVADAARAMRAARVCLAPLRFGAGLKGKLLDAMMAGTASVTTSIGAESMHGELAWNGAIRDDDEGFVDAAVALYQQQPLWQQAQHNGYRILNACYEASQRSTQLYEDIAALRLDLSRHRMNNFTGAMLTHHTMKSTMYMSRWIEAKNNLNRHQ